MVKGIIDRFEGEIAVVEVDGIMKDFPRDLFPEEASAGDVVKITENQIVVLKDETEKLRKEVEELMDEVWDD